MLMMAMAMAMMAIGRLAGRGARLADGSSWAHARAPGDARADHSFT